MFSDKLQHIVSAGGKRCSLYLADQNRQGESAEHTRRDTRKYKERERKETTRRSTLKKKKMPTETQKNTEKKNAEKTDKKMTNQLIDQKSTRKLLEGSMTTIMIIMTIITSIMVLAMASTVSAAKVAVVADISGTLTTECVNIAAGADGYQVLEATNLDLTWSEEGQYGHALCKVNGQGDEVAGTQCDWGDKYWGFYLDENNEEWTPSPVGFDGGDSCWNGDLTSWGGHYCAKDKDMIAISYGSFGDKPQHISYEEVCITPLQITDINVKVDGHSDRGIDETGGEFDATPGNEVQFTITVENKLDSGEIRDITARVEINNVGDDDIDEESDEIDLRDGDDDDLELSFEIPYDAKDKTYHGLLTVEGRDEKGGAVTLEQEFDMRIKRERHKIEIRDARFLEDTYTCLDKASLSLGIINIGRSDEDVDVMITNDATNMQMKKQIEVKDDNTRPEKLSFAIPLDNIKEGTYTFEIIADYDRETEYSSAVLVKKECTSAQSTSQNTEDEEQTSTNKQTSNTLNEKNGENTKNTKTGETDQRIELIYQNTQNAPRPTQMNEFLQQSQNNEKTKTQRQNGQNNLFNNDGNNDSTAIEYLLIGAILSLGVILVIIGVFVLILTKK